MAARRINATIIGLGKIGGSMAAALSESTVADWRVTGFDSDARRSQLASEHGIIHRASSGLDRAIRGADLVVLCVPVEAAVRLVPVVARGAPAGAVVVDTAGAKRPVVEAMALSGDRVASFGGHPIAGNEWSVPRAWDAAMFSGRPFVVIPAVSVKPTDCGILMALISSIGSRMIELAAREHDRLIAATSHVPLVASVALARMFAALPDDEQRDARAIAGGQLRAMTRMADSPPEMLAALLCANHDEVERAYERFDRNARALIAFARDPRARDDLLLALGDAAEFRRRLTPSTDTAEEESN